MRMTKREYFDLLVKTSAEGGFPALLPTKCYDDGNASVRCAYRGEGGRRCAVGLILPDDLYEEGFENKPSEHLPPTVLEAITPEGMTWGDLRRVQYKHDREAQTFAAWSHERFTQSLLAMGCFAEYAEEGESVE